MEATPLQKKVFVLGPDVDYGTFSFEDNLPKLPVPSLESTLDKYLKSVQPFVTEEEFSKTRSICENFKKSPKVQELQGLLLKRAEEKQSWMAEWWLDYAYLYYREPLIPSLNVSGPYALINRGPEQHWPVPVDQETSLCYLAQYIYHLVQFWKVLRDEKLKPDQGRDGTRFNMNQFKKLFNSARIPKKGKDEMVSIWKTKREGDCPTNMVISRNGHLFSVELFPDGTELSVDELMTVLRDVRVKAEALGRGQCVAALTRDDRDVWADNRSYLSNLDAINQESLKVVESAMFVAVLDEEEPKSYSDNCQKLMTGHPANRWADKSISVIQFANGFGGINCDHSPMDAMVSVVMNFFIHLGVLDLKGKWPSNGLKRKIDEPKLLQWKLDAKLQNSIQMSSSNVLKSNSEIVVKRDSFKQFGKTSIQKLKVNPDTFVQMGLQLAYYRLHGKPAPTYETATTRKYQGGRTETLRSSTNEALAFVKAMDDSNCDLTKKRTFLINAIATHDKLMKEAKEGYGCDRHLLGLSILASENGNQFTEDSDFKALYKDPAYTKSGGGGNFYLSTSTSGYTAMSGGATAMVLDGYGVFYNFEPHQVWVWLTNFRSSFVTSVEKFWVVLEGSMEDIYQTLASGQSKL